MSCVPTDKKISPRLQEEREKRKALKHPCPTCKKELSSLHNLRQHLQLKHGTTALVYKCEERGCDKTFPSARSRRSHMKAHRDRSQPVMPVVRATTQESLRHLLLDCPAVPTTIMDMRRSYNNIKQPSDRASFLRKALQSQELASTLYDLVTGLRHDVEPTVNNRSHDD